jgi:hypothetical protein
LAYLASLPGDMVGLDTGGDTGARTEMVTGAYQGKASKLGYLRQG